MITLGEGKALLFAGALASLVGYHFMALHTARAETDAAWQAKLEQAGHDAKAVQDALQAQIDAKAKVSNADLASKMDAIRANLAKLGTIYHPGTALPPGCVFDQARVAQANKAMQP